MGTISWYQLFLIGVFLANPIISDAAIINYFDIDGTVLHDSGVIDGKQPAFFTPWVLKRVASPNNGLGLADFEAAIAKGELPDRILVTRHEMDHLLIGKLAQGEAQTGDLTQIPLMPIPEFNSSKYDGKRPGHIIPGYYMVIDQITYRYHQDIEPKENVLLDSFREAVKRTESNPKVSYKGRAFVYLQRATRSQGPSQGPQVLVYFLSDRASRQTSIDALLKEMHQMGEISNSAVSIKMISLTDPHARIYGSHDELYERKATRIKMDVAELAHSQLKQHLTLAADINQAQSGTRQLMHEVRIYENDPDRVAVLLRQARALATQYPKVKFIMFHAGEEEAVAGADYNRGYEKPSRWVVFMPSGTGWRHPLPEELDEFEGRTSFSSVQTCSQALEGTKK